MLPKNHLNPHGIKFPTKRGLNLIRASQGKTLQGVLEDNHELVSAGHVFILPDVKPDEKEAFSNNKAAYKFEDNSDGVFGLARRVFPMNVKKGGKRSVASWMSGMLTNMAYVHDETWWIDFNRHSVDTFEYDLARFYVFTEFKIVVQLLSQIEDVPNRGAYVVLAGRESSNLGRDKYVFRCVRADFLSLSLSIQLSV